MDTGAWDTDPLQNDRTSASGTSKFLDLTVERIAVFFGCRNADARDGPFRVESTHWRSVMTPPALLGQLWTVGMIRHPPLSGRSPLAVRYCQSHVRLFAFLP